MSADDLFTVVVIRWALRDVTVYTDVSCGYITHTTHKKRAGLQESLFKSEHCNCVCVRHFQQISQTKWFLTSVESLTAGKLLTNVTHNDFPPEWILW